MKRERSPKKEETAWQTGEGSATQKLKVENVCAEMEDGERVVVAVALLIKLELSKGVKVESEDAEVVRQVGEDLSNPRKQRLTLNPT